MAAFMLCFAGPDAKWILATEESDGQLGIPGGRREKCENLEECLQREFFEETGMQCPPPMYSIQLHQDLYFGVCCYQ